MKDFFIGLALGIFIAGYTGLGCYMTAHERGYEKGISHTQLYYQATGQFPATDWVAVHEADNFYYEEQILETLKPFSLPEK